MTETRETRPPGRPWHLWAVGILGGLWSSMGSMSFVLTQLKVDAVMREFPPQQREYFESFPPWAVAFWAIGVFGGVLGCLLLLLRKRLAFPVLVASVAGAVVSNLGGLFLLGGMEALGNDRGLALVTPVAATFLAGYARLIHSRGVLG